VTTEPRNVEDSLSRLFSAAEADDLRARELPHPTVRASMSDLQGAVLFGAGRFSRALLPAMRRKGLEPAWLVDNNPALWGQRLEGVQIRAASSLTEAGDRLVLIMTTYLQSMAQACRDAGVKRWAWFTDIHEVFGDVSIAVSAETVLSDPDIDRLAAILEGDEVSLCTLKGALACRVTGETKDAPACLPDRYFAYDLIPPRAFSHFIDCGAFDGDTVREWLDSKALTFPPEQLRYHAFEPDPDNYSLLEKCVGEIPAAVRRRIVLHGCAVGDTSGSVGLIPGGDGTGVYKDHESGPVTPIARLDDVLADEEVGTIKMDVEGFEPLALEGARGILARQRPALLISVYHRPEHLWKIPLWIHDLGLGYRIFLRHHSTTSSETVCYAVSTLPPDAP